VDIAATHNRHGGRAEDSALSRICFQNGLTATMVCGSMVPSWRQVVVGEKGELRVEGDPGVVRIRRHDEPLWREIPRPAHEDWQVGFDGEVQALADSLDTGAPHPLEAQGAREALAVIMATYESSRRRQVVRFPVNVLENPLLSMLAGRETQ
jgi:predicted dehydrogenase